MPSRGKQTNSTQPGCSKSTDSKSFYPDLVTKGGLVNALNAELQMIGSPLTACGLSDQKPSGFPTYASVESGDSFCQVYIAAEERLFMHDFWRKGVCLAEGMTRDQDFRAGEVPRRIIMCNPNAFPLFCRTVCGAIGWLGGNGA